MRNHRLERSAITGSGLQVVAQSDNEQRGWESGAPQEILVMLVGR